MLSLALKTDPASLIRNVRLLFAFGVILAPLFSNAIAQKTSAREIAFPTTIQWNKQKGVTRYRLQIAADEKFQDVFFDGPVKGERRVVNNLSPGYYYWRVAPADSSSGFSKPVRFFVSGGVVITAKPPR